MADAVTSISQFKACLANEAARRRIGIELSDAEALRVLSSDDQTERWYRWWSERPDMAIASVSRQHEAVRQAEPHRSPPALPVDAGPVRVADGVLGLCAGPASYVALLIFSGLAFSLVQSQGADAALGLLLFGTLVALVIACLGVGLSALCLRGGSRAATNRPRRLAAIVLGSIGLAVSILAALFWLVSLARVVAAGI